MEHLPSDLDPNATVEGLQPTALQPVGTLPVIPGFQMIEAIGNGAMGEVYRATRTADGLEVAIKVMIGALMERQDLVRRFEREINLLTSLRHPNIACAVDSGRVDGRLYLAMEYVRGPTLSSLLKLTSVMSETDVLRILRQLAMALDNAWKTTGLIHRDIKPSNLLVIPDGSGGETVKIIDFGLARSMWDEDMSMTMTGMVMGTPNYMSPEQIRGDKDLGIQADMYALGCTAFHLLTGRLPFPLPTPAEVMSAHLSAPVPDPGDTVPSLSPATRHLIRTCMAKLSNKRYGTYEQVIAACDAALRTIELRDVSSVRLLRRPMVLSRPSPKRLVTGDPDDTFGDSFGFETARLERHAKTESDRASDYRPSTEAIGGVAPASRMNRRGAATEALTKAATDSIRRRKHTTRQILRGAGGGSSTGPNQRGVSDPEDGEREKWLTTIVTRRFPRARPAELPVMAEFERSAKGRWGIPVGLACVAAIELILVAIFTASG